MIAFQLICTTLISLVDADGNVTGLIDWDGATVGPRQGAFARYPSRVTRDWDPLMYDYRETGDDDAEDLFREAQQEDPPETLSRFRDECAIFTRLNPDHGRLTRFSHLLETLEIAIQLPFTRPNILDKPTKYVYGGNDDAKIESISLVTLSQRLSTAPWLRDTVGEAKRIAGGEYV
ncbi:hypothetical protein DFH07DRAFT_1036388 [Mycena maculata]|uniref:Aminoglycoside phosphotransferase domain-containing protein n=1 Tax=Mycena maculata TaxID=230809 RepID=A0AAD7K3W6_9AGAR|nr:hypothetical protein DFH07DRAFT_1036388 [Mycena maculata]